MVLSASVEFQDRQLEEQENLSDFMKVVAERSFTLVAVKYTVTGADFSTE